MMTIAILKTTLLENITIATWNIRGISQKLGEVINEIKKRRIDIMVVSETKKRKGKDWKKSMIIYFYFPEKDIRAASGIGIIKHKTLRSRIISYSCVNDRIRVLKVRTGRLHCNIIGVYTPT